MLPFCVRTPMSNRGGLLITCVLLIGGIATIRGGWNGNKKLGWVLGGFMTLGGLAVLAVSIMMMVGDGK